MNAPFTSIFCTHTICCLQDTTDLFHTILNGFRHIDAYWTVFNKSTVDVRAPIDQEVIEKVGAHIPVDGFITQTLITM